MFATEQTNDENLPDSVPPHMDFIGQRADKIKVTDVKGVEDIEQSDGIVREGVVKIVDHYTVSCNECDADGYYDDLGEIICEGCGMVLSDKQAVIRTEYSEGDGKSIGNGRGVEVNPDRDVPGTHEPG